jgi:TPR repeat protein
MKVFSILMLSLLATSQCIFAGSLDTESIFKNSSPSILLVTVKDKKGNEFIGTGFVIDKTGILVTNYHVIEGAKYAVAKAQSGKQYHINKILAKDEYHDIAILAFETDGIESLKLGNSDEVKTGMDIAVIGNPVGLENTISEGLISGVRKSGRKGSILQISAPISKGSSGSPIFDKNGEVVGMASCLLKNGQALNFAIPSNDIKKLFNTIALDQPSLNKARESSDSSSTSGSYETAEEDFRRGLRYEMGMGYPKDTVEAVKWFTLAAQKGFVDAEVTLGFCYAQGMGIPQNLDEAVHWYKKAADDGSAKAKFLLAQCYISGQGVEKDPVKAKSLLLDSADHGYAQAQNDIAWTYCNGVLSDRDATLGFSWYKKAADQGLAASQLAVGEMYLQGTGTEKDVAQAFTYLEKSANQGNSEALYNLAYLYEHGIGVTESRPTAISYYKKSAESGFTQAEYNLGVIYQDGLGVDRDYQTSVFWFQRAAAKDCYPADVNLGVDYLIGRGVPKDLEKSKEWFLKAEKSDDSEVQSQVKKGLQMIEKASRE